MTIGNVPVKALLDTGSDYSLVSSSIAANLPYHQPSPLSLWSVNSQAVIVLGQCLLQATVDDLTVHQVVHIVRDLPFQVLLGRDFMHTYLASLDFCKWKPVFDRDTINNLPVFKSQSRDHLASESSVRNDRHSLPQSSMTAPVNQGHAASGPKHQEVLSTYADVDGRWSNLNQFCL